jgi:uncharacterized paraquat-inducible protein A
MIEVDPLQYLGENYLVRWQCPSCEERTFVRLGELDTASCPACGQMLTPEDRDALRRFKQLIA